MTNKELIEKLLKFPLTATVFYEDINFGGPLEDADIGDFKYIPKCEKYCPCTTNCNMILINSPQQDYID